MAHPLEVSLYNINLIWHKNDDAATQRASKYKERKKLKMFIFVIYTACKYYNCRLMRDCRKFAES